MKKDGNSTIFETIPQIKKYAKQSIKKGALTKDYPLDIHKAHKYLNSALATEIMCVLRYRHHQIVAKGINSKEVANEFEEHAKEEERHMLMIAKRIDELGGNPDLNPVTCIKNAVTEYGSADNLIEMIEDDLVAERVVISIYREMIDWFGLKDPTTRRMLESILKDEEEHANDLSDLLYSNSKSR